MVVNSSTFISDTILFIRDYLKAQITDPLNRSGGVGFVMTAFPKREQQYPLITIKATNFVTEKLGMQSEVSRLKFNLEVRTWCTNSKQSDEMTQQVIDKMRTYQFDATGTTANAIYGFKLESCNPIVETQGDNTVHSKVCNFSYSEILE